MSDNHQFIGRRALAAISAAIALIVVAATAAAAFSAAGASKLRIAGVVAQTPDPYFVSMKCGALAAAKKLGNVSLSWQGPVQPSVSQQITALNSVAVTKPDGVILTPFSPTAFLQPVSKLMKQGIPVALTDAYLSKNSAYSATYTDVSKSGPVLARRIAGLIGGKGEVGIVAFGAGDPFEHLVEMADQGGERRGIRTRRLACHADINGRRLSPAPTFPVVIPTTPATGG